MRGWPVACGLASRPNMASAHLRGPIEDVRFPRESREVRDYVRVMPRCGNGSRKLANANSVDLIFASGKSLRLSNHTNCICPSHRFYRALTFFEGSTYVVFLPDLCSSNSSTTFPSIE